MQGAGALGFGPLPSSATLGQPLDLAIPLRLDANEALSADCLAGQVYFADALQQAGTTTLRLDPARPDVSDRVLRLVTTTRVDEPIVTVELTVGCTAKVGRRFTLFADPPVVTAIAEPATAPSAGATPPAAADAAPPALPSRPRATAAPRPTARIRPTAPRRAAAPTPAPAPAAAATTTAPRAAATAPARRSTEASPKLQLAPLEAGARVAAAEPSAAELAASAVAAEQAASAALAAEAAASARAAELATSLAKLRSDTLSAQQSISGLKTQLEQAQADRVDRSVLYALLAVVALLLALAAWLWRQRNQERESHAWLAHAAANPGHGTPAGDAATAEAVAFAPEPGPASAVAAATSIDADRFKDSGAAGLGGPSTRPWPMSMPAPLGDRAAEQKREVSVEELIDLEQQAEFFVVLGQDEAAIDLLMGHLRSTSGASPLPYLKLLEIYKRRGERRSYEQLRERFNSRFSALAPAWEVDLQDGRSLEDYPPVLERLTKLWGQPQRSMDVLQATLLRSDGNDASSESFDLPAYRELMLLYAVARDRSEADVGGTVDLLLPIGEGDGSAGSGMFERLVATTSLEAQPSVHRPLEVDVALDDPGPTDPAALGFLPTDIDPASTSRKV